MSTRRLSALAGLQLSWASVLMVAGCSTYQGQKLGTTADQKVISPTGVPYMLVRPEYALSLTVPAEGDKKPTYTVAVAYVTDPSQMYTLRINPGAFANADFVVKLGTTGAMQGTTTTLTETVTPAITALG